MALPKARFIRPTDGVMGVYRQAASRGVVGVDFSASDGLEHVCDVHFSQSLCRQSDLELADGGGWRIARKVSARHMPEMSTLLVVEIGGVLYEVPYMDIDHAAQLMWLHLDDLHTDGTVELLDRSNERDSIGNTNGALASAGVVFARRRSHSASKDDGGGQDFARQSVTVTLRTCDWGGGHDIICRDGVRYDVKKADMRGDWVDVSATARLGDS